jgi:hypothetical protein
MCCRGAKTGWPDNRDDRLREVTGQIWLYITTPQIYIIYTVTVIHCKSESHQNLHNHYVTSMKTNMLKKKTKQNKTVHFCTNMSNKHVNIPIWDEAMMYKYTILGRFLICCAQHVKLIYIATVYGKKMVKRQLSAHELLWGSHQGTMSSIITL